MILQYHIMWWFTVWALREIIGLVVELPSVFRFASSRHELAE